jgi:hypothetical protein
MYKIGQIVRFVGTGKVFQNDIEIKGEKALDCGGYDGIFLNPEFDRHEDYYTLSGDEGSMYAESSLEPIDPDNESAGSWEDVMQEFKVGETA